MVEEGNESDVNTLIEECLYLDSKVESIEELSYKLKEGIISA